MYVGNKDRAECVIGFEQSTNATDSLLRQKDVAHQLVTFCSLPKSNYNGGYCFGQLALDYNNHHHHHTMINICQFATNPGPAYCANELLPSQRHDNELLLSHQFCSQNGTKEMAQCANHLMHQYDDLLFQDRMIISLCKNIRTVNSLKSVIYCIDTTISYLYHSTTATFNTQTSPTTIPTIILELCRYAYENNDTSEIKAVVQCFQMAPSMFNDTQKALLCSRSNSSSGMTAIHCVKTIPSIWKQRMIIDEMIQLCHTATTTMNQNYGPSTCISAMPLSISIDTAIQTCKDAKNSEPAICFKESSSILKRNSTLQSQLCSKATLGHVAVQCLEHLPHSLPVSIKVSLCQSLSNNYDYQERCSKMVWGDHHHCFTSRESSAIECLNETEHIIHEFCRNENKIGCTSCYDESRHLNFSQLQRYELCRYCPSSPSSAFSHFKSNVQGDNFENFMTTTKGMTSGRIECATYGIKSGIRKSIISKLCSHAINQSPIKCFNEISPSSSESNDDAIILCQGITTKPEIACTKSNYISPLPMRHRINLCRGTPSHDYMIPALCFQKIRHIGIIDATHLCRGSNNLTPAYCAKSQQQSTLSNQVIQHCKNSLSLPADLRVTSMNYDNDELIVGSNITLTLSIYDQYSQFRFWDNTTQTNAHIYSNGLTKTENDSSIYKINQSIVGKNTSINGRIMHHLQVIQTGEFILKLKIQTGSSSHCQKTEHICEETVETTLKLIVNESVGGKDKNAEKVRANEKRVTIDNIENSVPVPVQANYGQEEESRGECEVAV